MTKDCPYCGKECVKAECPDGNYRHYCPSCNAVELLEGDFKEYKLSEREQQTGWKLISVEIEI